MVRRPTAMLWAQFIRLIKLPPYSPFLNIVEQALALLKQQLKPTSVAPTSKQRWMTALKQGNKESHLENTDIKSSLLQVKATSEQ